MYKPKQFCGDFDSYSVQIWHGYQNLAAKFGTNIRICTLHHQLQLF